MTLLQRKCVIRTLSQHRKACIWQAALQQQTLQLSATTKQQISSAFCSIAAYASFFVYCYLELVV